MRDTAVSCVSNTSSSGRRETEGGRRGGEKERDVCVRESREREEIQRREREREREKRGRESDKETESERRERTRECVEPLECPACGRRKRSARKCKQRAHKTHTHTQKHTQCPLAVHARTRTCTHI